MYQIEGLLRRTSCKFEVQFRRGGRGRKVITEYHCLTVRNLLNGKVLLKGGDPQATAVQTAW